MLDFSTILSGMGLLFSFGSSSRQNLPTHTDAEALCEDWEAIRKDWEAVGADMRWAMDNIGLKQE